MVNMFVSVIAVPTEFKSVVYPGGWVRGGRGRGLKGIELPRPYHVLHNYESLVFVMYD